MDSRQQFEEAWALAMRGDDGAPANRPLRSQIDPERYRGDAVNFAWSWWQRSRIAIVIDLPTTCASDDPRKIKREIADQLNDNGIRTK